MNCNTVNEVFVGLKINMGSNGRNVKVYFLKNSSITFFA